MKIIYKAGLVPWEKPFQNLRATRETELAQTYPLHVVTAWIGNSIPIAAKHYLKVTDADFTRAATGGAESGAVVTQKAAQTGADAKRPEGTEVGQTPGNKVVCPLPSSPVSYCLDVQYPDQESNPERLVRTEK